MTAQLIHDTFDNPDQMHTIVGDHARRQVAEHALDTDDMRDLGLMLGLFTYDDSGRLETTTPYDSHPNVLNGIVA